MLAPEKGVCVWGGGVRVTIWADTSCITLLLSLVRLSKPWSLQSILVGFPHAFVNV